MIDFTSNKINTGLVMIGQKRRLEEMLQLHMLFYHFRLLCVLFQQRYTTPRNSEGADVLVSKVY